MAETMRSWLNYIFVVLVVLAVYPLSAIADEGPKDYRSAHVVLHTDMSSDDARELLSRLETILGLISKYWGQPLQGEIECYVVRDLSVWPAGVLSDLGRAKIQAKSGITTTQTINRGERFIAGKAIVYAFADGGTPQHEIVHAFCGQTFGRTGPLWYSEGMAELGQYWQKGEVGVQCKPYMIDYLRHTATKSVKQIVAEDAADGQSTGPVRTGDSWQAYTCRWALCHLLVNNPTYSARFRTLGLAYLNGATLPFDRVFGSMKDELEFEYQLFLKHVDQGYRADLCRWDWHHKFREPTRTATTERLMANRGWQPSGTLVARGKHYEYSATGKWRLSKDGEETDAAGLPSGDGRLEAVVFHDFKLSEPFLLSTGGIFTVPLDGKLFLRCRENWSELADNTGVVTVKIKESKRGPELPRPAETANLQSPAPSDP